VTVARLHFSLTSDTQLSIAWWREVGVSGLRVACVAVLPDTWHPTPDTCSKEGAS